jgi:probable HAF family extracellular repeat protein
VNNCGQVVGESFVNLGEPKQEAERAFLWSASAGMINLGKSFDGWSRAIAINDRGVVLGWRQRGPVVCGFGWSQERGMTDILGLGGRGFYHCALNVEGLVVGEGEDSNGRRRAFIWTQASGLKQLAVPDEFHPSDIDVHGNVLGNVYSRPWHQPGIYDATRNKYFELPMAYSHHTFVKAINDDGVIIGEARTDSSKHVHPLVLTLSQRSSA